MAEILGVTTGIISLVSLALTVSQVSYDYVQTVRGSSSAIARYLQEVLALTQSLLKVQEALAQPGISAAVSSVPDEELLPKILISECYKELDSIKRKLQKRLETRSTLGMKVQTLTWPFQEKDTLEIVEKLSRWNSTCSSIVSAYNLRVSNSTLNVVKTQRNESQRTDVLNWLHPSKTAMTNDEIINTYHEDTCLWILDDDHYRQWLQGQPDFLICTGDPGAGKTIATSFLIRQLSATSPPETPVLYHYFHYRADHDEHKVSSVIRHLLRQLLDYVDSVPQEILQLFANAGKSRSELTDKVWLDVFCKILRSFSRVFVMLDGFDECHDRRGLGRLLRSLKHSRAKVYVAGRPPIDVPVGFIDRCDIKIKAHSDDLAIYITATLEEDPELDELLSHSLKNEIVSILTNYADGVFLLVKLALKTLSGLTTVRQIRSALLTIPKSLDSAHQATFDRILWNTTVKRALALKALGWILLAERPLSMNELLHAVALEQGETTVDTENLTTSKTVIGACLGFIEHHEHGDQVQFTHATVQEFLYTKRSDILAEADLEIARACINYLAQPAFDQEICPSSEEVISRLSDFPLLSFAASHWGQHARQYQMQLTVEITRLLESPKLVSNAAQVFHYRRRTKAHLSEVTFLELPQNLSKTHLLSLWGLADIASLQSPSYAEITSPDSLGWTPLHWAAARGHPDMATFLLTRGALIEAKDMRDWTPLFWAAFWSRVKVVRLLLEKGAESNAQDKDGETPLHIAISRGNTDVCHELLEHLADWSVKSARNIRPVDQALKSSVPEIASLFLNFMSRENDSIPSTKDDSSRETALERAVAWAPSEQDSVFRITLQGEITAAERPDWVRPLYARLQQHESKLKAIDPDRLTDIGSDAGYSWFCEDLICQDDYLAGVLGYAILTERYDMVKTLIDFGVDLNVPWGRKFKRIHYMQFPVLLASYTGNARIIDLLVNAGASVEVFDYEGRNPLHYAVILGHVEAAQTLCKHTQLFKLLDKDDGKSPLHAVWAVLIRAESPTAATIQTYLTLAELLVQNGADVNLQSRFGASPLFDAVRTQRMEPVLKMIELGADPNIRAQKEIDYWQRRHIWNEQQAETDPNGDTPFTLACKEHRIDQAAALSAAGAVIPKDLDLRSSVVRATADADMSALHALFGSGPAALVAGGSTDEDPPLITSTIRTLQWVMDEQTREEADFRRPFVSTRQAPSIEEAPSRYRAVAEFLLTVGQDPNATASGGRTALLEALEYEYNHDLVEMLLSRGADIQACSSDGTNAFHVVAASGILSYVKLILGKGLEINSQSKLGHTPLQLAAANGHEDIVKLLLDQPALDNSLRNKHDWLLLAQCHRAITSRDLSRFQDLASKTPPPVTFTDRNGQTLLHLAASMGIAEIVSTLLDLGADVTTQDIRGDTPLHVAAASDAPSIAVMDSLVAHGADVRVRNFAGATYGIHRNPHDATALHLAAYNGNVEIVKAVLEHAVVELGSRKARGTNDSSSPVARRKAISSGSRSPSPPAPRYRDPPFIDWTSDGCGRTALMCAVERNQILTATCLLDMGASVNAHGGRGSWGFSALDLARPRELHNAGVQSGDGNDSHSGTGSGRDSEAGTAAAAQQSEMVRLLLEHGAEEFDW